MEHWTKNFDWQNASYILRMDGYDHDPCVGWPFTLKAAFMLANDFNAQVIIAEASHNYDVAFVLEDALYLYDLHDDEGDRLPYRAPLEVD